MVFNNLFRESTRPRLPLSLALAATSTTSRAWCARVSASPPLAQSCRRSWHGASLWPSRPWSSRSLPVPPTWTLACGGRCSTAGSSASPGASWRFGRLRRRGTRCHRFSTGKTSQTRSGRRCASPLLFSFSRSLLSSLAPTFSLHSSVAAIVSPLLVGDWRVLVAAYPCCRIHSPTLSQCWVKNCPPSRSPHSPSPRIFLVLSFPVRPLDRQ